MPIFEKLKQNYEFRRLYRKGRSFVCPYFVLYVLKGRKEKVRLGITVGKKIGGAVERNRAKRLVFAAFRESLENITSGFDFVIVARTRLLSVKSTVCKAELCKMLKDADLYLEDKSDE